MAEASEKWAGQTKIVGEKSCGAAGRGCNRVAPSQSVSSFTIHSCSMYAGAGFLLDHPVGRHRAIQTVIHGESSAFPIVTCFTSTHPPFFLYGKHCISVIFTSPAGAVAKYCDEHVCLCVCLSVRQDISEKTRAIFTKLFVYVACVRGSVLLRHVYGRPHRLSPKRGFLSLKNALSVEKGGWECTPRAKCTIYDCLVKILTRQGA